MRRQIASAIDIIVQVSRLPDGRRRIMSITEVTGVGDNIITMQEHFRFEPLPGPDRTERDHWQNNGLRPHTRKLENVKLKFNGLEALLAQEKKRV